jgi:hypothetical protein
MFFGFRVRENSYQKLNEGFCKKLLKKIIPKKKLLQDFFISLHIFSKLKNGF